MVRAPGSSGLSPTTTCRHHQHQRDHCVWSNLYKGWAVPLSSPTSIGTDRRHNPLPSPDWADRSRMNVHSTVPNSPVSVSKVFGWCLQHSDQSRGPVKLDQPSRPRRAETQDLQKRTNAQDAKRNLNTKRHRRGTNERYDRTTANLIQTKTKNSTAMNQASRSTTTTQEHWHYKHNPYIWEFVSTISVFISKTCLLLSLILH